jgi:hypothetical protein
MRPVAMCVQVAVLTSVLAACGDAEGAPAPATVTVTVPPDPIGSPVPSRPVESSVPAAVNACALLPHAEAQALAGTRLGKATAGSPANPSCAYTGPATGPLAQVEIYVGDGAKKYYEIDRKLGSTMKRVPGLGDEGHLKVAASTVYFRKAQTWVVIRVVRLEDAAKFVKPLEAQARKVAARL